MKKIIQLCLILLTTACELNSELYHRPFLITEEAQVHDEGVILKAHIEDIKQEDIIKAGFIINKIEGSSFLVLTDSVYKNGYQYNLTYGLTEGEVYFVTSYINTNQLEIYGNEIEFKSNGCRPPKIIGFSPKSGKVHTPVVLEIENVLPMPEKVHLYLGDKPCEIESFNSSKMIIKAADTKKSGNFMFKLVSGPNESVSTDQFELSHPWSKRNNINSISHNSSAFTYEQKAYIINPGEDKNMIIYNVETEELEKIAMPESAGDYPVAYSYNYKGYIFLKSKFWEYNTQTDQWLEKAHYPGLLPEYSKQQYSFSVNNKLYLGNLEPPGELWAYHIESNQWEPCSSLSVEANRYNNNFSFSINQKGFIGITSIQDINQSFWVYQPEADTWSQRSPFPSKAYRGFICLTINQELYLGLGVVPSATSPGFRFSSDIWKFHEETDQWEKLVNCPETLLPACSFTIKDKGYVIFHNGTYITSPSEKFYSFFPPDN